MSNIKNVNSVKVNNKSGLFSVDYIEYNNEIKSNCRNIVDLELNWVNNWIQTNYNTTVNNWVQNITTNKIAHLFTSVDACGGICVDYVMGWRVK